MLGFLTQELIHGARRTPPGYPVAVCAVHLFAALAVLGVADDLWRRLTALFTGA